MTEENFKSFKKHTISCNNCGKTDHVFKSCSEPICSFGIILLQLDIESSIKKKIIERLTDPNEEFNYNAENKMICVNDYNDMELFSLLKNTVKVLLIQRKHSVGFVEFMRGRYSINNVDGIIFLFKQMTPDEIHRIAAGSFDDLWDYLWGTNKHGVSHLNDYNISKNKFEKLKMNGNGHLGLQFYVTDIIPDYKFPEWGFPKGRKNTINEDGKHTAQREFTEETNFGQNNYIILNKIQPIEESLIGTNGISYKHIYYVAIENDIEHEKPHIKDDNINQINEIGDINFFLYEDAMKIIRPYHIDKQKIITQLYMFMMNKLIKYVKEL
jgi:8-oxo-dGTP pyrophosphatase MutT (NUDIX family)